MIALRCNNFPEALDFLGRDARRTASCEGL
jgi:hypothetical protein